MSEAKPKRGEDPRNLYYEERLPECTAPHPGAPHFPCPVHFPRCSICDAPWGQKCDHRDDF